MNAGQLAGLITATPELLALVGDAAALLAALNDENIEFKDSTRYTYKVFSIRFGPELANRALAGLEMAKAQPEAALLRAAYLDLTGQGENAGLDFSDAGIQAQIDLLAATLVPSQVWQAGDAAAIKSIGVWHKSIVQERLQVAEATAEDVTAAIAEMDKQSFFRTLQQRFSAVLAGVTDGSITTEEQAIAKFGE